MSGSGSSRVPIPSGMKKTIQDIKEIARDHSDDEILAMLEECSMDPNETVYKLLLQDTFHEVKRKRDRRKENLHREPTDSRWKPGMQGRGTRNSRGSYHPRYSSHDTGTANDGKEEGRIQAMEKVTVSSSLDGTQETENKSGVSAASSVDGVAYTSRMVPHTDSSPGSGSDVPDGSTFSLGEECSGSETKRAGFSLPSSVDFKHGSKYADGIGHSQPSPKQSSLETTVVFATVDAVIVSSPDAHVSGSCYANKCEGGNEKAAVGPAASKDAYGQLSDLEMANKETSSEIFSSAQVKMPTKAQVLDASQLSEASQSPSSDFLSTSLGSKPSNFDHRSQVLDSQKVLIKEWKPKSLNQTHQASVSFGTSASAHIEVETNTQTRPVQASKISEESTSIQRKLEELHFSDGQHVFIPDHLQVPEAERCGLSFGSFDANFGLGMLSTSLNDADSETCSIPLTESSQVPDEDVEESTLSTQKGSSAVQEELYSQHIESSSQIPESASSKELNVSINSSAVAESEQQHKETAVAQGGSQFSVAHTAPAYSALGLIPPVLGGHLSPFESSEMQGREAARIGSFVVQQPFDPASYYTQVYRPGADGDGRFSPFLSHSAATKYGGNNAVIASQMGQTTQETVNSLIPQNTGITAQTTGAMQSSVAVTQQPVPVFRQPAGVHIPHYPPNYMPYGHYFSPFYIPTPTLHHFFSNALPQQPLAGSIFSPPPPAATTPTVKYSLSQQKGGANGGNSNTTVLPIQGPYGSSATGYPSTTVTTGNATASEDHTISQYKDNNFYIPGHQSEGSAVWLPAAGRDIPGVGMQAGSFYNLPQGQQMAFASPQAGNGTFAGIYPNQAVGGATTVHPMLQPPQTIGGTVEMVGAAAGVYQQPPQRAPINWASNY